MKRSVVQRRQAVQPAFLSRCCMLSAWDKRVSLSGWSLLVSLCLAGAHGFSLSDFLSLSCPHPSLSLFFLPFYARDGGRGGAAGAHVGQEGRELVAVQLPALIRVHRLEPAPAPPLTASPARSAQHGPARRPPPPRAWGRHRYRGPGAPIRLNFRATASARTRNGARFKVPARLAGGSTRPHARRRAPHPAADQAATRPIHAGSHPPPPAQSQRAGTATGRLPDQWRRGSASGARHWRRFPATCSNTPLSTTDSPRDSDTTPRPHVLVRG